MNIFHYISWGIFAFSSVIYIFIIYIKKEKNSNSLNHNNKYAVLICARNEEKVIGNLLESIKLQNYPHDWLKIFVIADNCSDNTAIISRSKGAIVFERKNKVRIGKGYALDYLLNKIRKQYKEDNFDGYIVLDADNLLDKEFISEINKVFSSGCDVVTSYRNSKNFESNWISSTSGLWFIYDSCNQKYNKKIGKTCFVSGTGFMFSKKVLKLYNGWPFHSIAEDSEFMMSNQKNNIKVLYAEKAIIYDEQPRTLSSFWNQRLRWNRGNIEIIKNNFKYYLKRNNTVFLNIPNNITISTVYTLVNFIIIIMLLLLSITQHSINYSFVLKSIILSYFMSFLVALSTIIFEFKNINAKTIQKISTIIMFPIMIDIYVINFISSIFINNIEWKQIEHSCNKSIKNMDSKN